MNLPNNIAIIGMGLIGGSIAKALKKRVPHVVLASLDQGYSDLGEAISQKVVDRLFASWEELLLWSDLVILASPLSTLSSVAEEIAKRSPKGKKLLVIDVSSVKKEIVPTFEKLTAQNLEFLSTHPMAGKETSGFANSDPGLFQGCCWILSPHEKNQTASIEAISKFVEMLGGEAILIDPKEHDVKVALISHLPALLSRLYLGFVEQKDPESLKIAGPGFRSMTRLAKDNPQMQREIAELNCEEIRKQLTLFLRYIEESSP